MKNCTNIQFFEFRKNLTECVNLTKYKGERFLITKNGKAVGAFVPIEDLEKIQAATEKSELSQINQNLSEGLDCVVKLNSHRELDT